jgi:AraC-like DNA-binding protein
VLQRRIKRAKELLAARHMSLAEIGYALGFPSQAHFTTTFRKLAGTTPGAYRAGFSHFGSEIVQGTRNQPADYERPETAFAAILTQGSLRSQWSMPG